MEKFVSQHAFLTVQEYELIQSCLDNARIKIPEDQDDELKFDISTFQTFVNYLNYEFVGAFKYRTTRGFVTVQFMKFYYHNPGSVSKYKPEMLYGEIQVWIRFNLAKDFGHHLLRNKTFNDRIMSWLMPKNNRFRDDKSFTKKFVVLSDDHSDPELFFTNQRRALLIQAELKQLYLELKNDVALAGTRKVIDKNEFSEILALISRMG